MNKELHLCNSEPEARASHSLVVVKWKYTDNGKCNTAKHATQLVCEKCFKLFDFQEMSDFHMMNNEEDAK